jgi:hypothetical protein
MKNIKTLSIEEGYVLSKFREARNEQVALVFNSLEQNLAILEGMKFFNTRKNELEEF